MTLSIAEISGLVGVYFWPFVRISAMLMAAPIFGAKNILFVVHRLALALILTVVAQPYISHIPAVEPFSFAGMLMFVEQMLIGLVIGFMLQLAFSSLIIAGNSVALTMGLGFASFLDPATGVSVPIVSKFYLVIGTLLFFAMDGHLVAIKILVESFSLVSVTQSGVSVNEIFGVVLWGGKMYVGALLIALPCMVTITLINIGFGVMTRSAPQMNIFAVGFPTTLAAGVIIIMLTLPNLLPRFTDLVMDSFNTIQTILKT